MDDSSPEPVDRAEALRRAARRADAPREDPLADTGALDETVADEPLVPEGDLDADPTFDNLFAHDIVSLDQIDPEAGRMSVARRVRQVRKAASTPEGQFVLAVPFALGGITLAIFALVYQTTPWIIAGAVVAPLTFYFTWSRFRHWLGHKRYTFRVLETLGEDVSDYTPHQMYRATKVKARAKRRRR